MTLEEEQAIWGAREQARHQAHVGDDDDHIEMMDSIWDMIENGLVEMTDRLDRIEDMVEGQYELLGQISRYLIAQAGPGAPHPGLQRIAENLTRQRKDEKAS